MSDIKTLQNSPEDDFDDTDGKIYFDEILTKADREIKPLPILRFSVERRACRITDSKLGGMPYFPKDMEYPRGLEGDYKDKPLRLLAQLNFGELPHIEDFPERGILQIFIACEDDGTYGWDDGKPVQNGYRVIYHANVTDDLSRLMTEDDLPISAVYQDDDGCFPFTGEFALIADQTGMGFPGFSDYRFCESIVRNYNELSGENIKNYWDIDIDDGMYDYIANRSGEKAAFIGGYPEFTQSDPREGVPELAKFDRVLFELLSVKGEGLCEWDVCWGDVGTGCFMIPAENLRECDFSQVIYNYDCG